MTSSSDTADRAAAGTHHREPSAGDVFWPRSIWYIAATAAALMLFWPLGLAMLAWALWHR